MHKIHSSELLNITREAVEAGREFMTEVETPATYNHFDDVINKLKNVLDIFVTHWKRIAILKVTIQRLSVTFYNTTWYDVGKRMYNIKRKLFVLNDTVQVFEDIQDSYESIVLNEL